MLNTRFFSLLLLFCSCSGLQNSEREKIRRQNAKGEFVYRRHDEIVYAIPPTTPQTREKYPWEDSYIGTIPRISKEWFRCKGASSHPSRIEKKEGGDPVHLYDCAGCSRHSLPLRGEEEFIYPILIEILNEIQEKTGKRVVVTCGHRCPQHNIYADGASAAQTSKHMIGAEVDFYVRGLEHEPELVIKTIMNYFKRHPRYQGKKEFQEFSRYEKKDTDVSIQPWLNKEIFIKLYQRHEGRDFDNRHPYPYISVQVRADRETGQRVIYTWPQANSGFKRY